jgi:hypothetical protein
MLPEGYARRGFGFSANMKIRGRPLSNAESVPGAVCPAWNMLHFTNKIKKKTLLFAKYFVKLLTVVKKH